MITSPVLLSSKSEEWPTSPEFFRKMNRRYGPFDIDVCATAENAKCPRFFTKEEDGLRQPWTGRCWMNPPYGRPLPKWLRKAVDAALTGATVVCLLPARPDTRWWHDYVKPFARKVDFIRGRLRFGDGKYPAPFPSVVVVFAPARQQHCRWCEKRFLPKRTGSKFCSGACRQAAYRARQTAPRVTATSITEEAKPDDTGTAAKIDWQAAGIRTSPERN